LFLFKKPRWVAFFKKKTGFSQPWQAVTKKYNKAKKKQKAMNWISYQCDEHIVFQKPSTLFLNFSLYCYTHEHFSLWISLFCSRKCNISNIFSRTT